MTRTESFILERSGAKNLSIAVEVHALRCLVETFGHTQVDEVDCEAVAATLGVPIVEASEGLGKAVARLVTDGRRLIVLLRPDLDRHRRNYAIAHELGHSMFFEACGETQRHRIGVLNEQEMAAEERVCDRFARALLFPRSLTEKFLEQLNHLSSAEILLRIDEMARRSGVGIGTVVSRCSDLPDLFPPRPVLLWRWAENSLTKHDPSVRLSRIASDKSRFWLWRNRTARSMGFLSVTLLADAWIASANRSRGKFVRSPSGRLRPLAGGVFQISRDFAEVAWNTQYGWRRSRGVVESSSVLYAYDGTDPRSLRILTVVSPDGRPR